MFFMVFGLHLHHNQLKIKKRNLTETNLDTFTRIVFEMIIFFYSLNK